MAPHLKNKLVNMLRWSERYTGTDMVYLAGGSFWLVIEQSGGVLLSFALATVFGHFAAPDMYGNYKFVLSLTALVGALSLSRLGDAVGQSVARGNEGTFRQGFWLNLKWSWAFVAACLVTAGYYAFFAGNPFVAAALTVAAFLQPLLGSAMLFPSFLFGKRDIMRGSLYLLFVNTVTTLAVAAALFIGERAILLVATYFVARTIAALYATYKARRHVANTREDPQLLHYGAHLSLMGVISTIADAFDSLIVFTLLGPSNLAIYAFAIAVPEQIKGIVKNLNNLVFPKFAEQPLSNIKKTIMRKLTLLTLGIAGALGAYVLTAQLIFDTLFPLYTEAVTYSRWYALSIIFAGVSQILYTALYAHKKTAQLYVISNVPPFILIGSLIVLVPIFGIMGAIVSQIIFRAAHFILSIVLFYRTSD